MWKRAKWQHSVIGPRNNDERARGAVTCSRLSTREKLRRVCASEEDNCFGGRPKPGEPHGWLRGATNPQAGAQRTVGVVRNGMDGPSLSVGNAQGHGGTSVQPGR